MYAIVDINGKQFKVEKDQTLEIHKINSTTSIIRKLFNSYKIK